MDAGAAVSKASNPETTIPMTTTINKEKAIMVCNLHMTHGNNTCQVDDSGILFWYYIAR